jgi:hypothetical protein
MKSVLNRQGLIVATNVHTTAELDELIVCSGWPVLMRATPQRLGRELSLALPKCSLFWLDDQSDLKGAMQLLSWLSDFPRAVRRIAVAYCLAAEVEVAARTAGAHLYLAADGNIAGLVEGWMPRLLSGDDHRGFASSEPALASDSRMEWKPHAEPLSTVPIHPRCAGPAGVGVGHACRGQPVNPIEQG